MSELLKAFGKSYQGATRSTLGALVVTVAITIFAIQSAWNGDLEELQSEIEFADRLITLWEQEGRPALEILCSSDSVGYEACETRYTSFMKKHGSPKSLKALQDVRARLELERNDRYQREPPKLFGIEFPSENSTLTRWLLPAGAMFLLCLFFTHERSLMDKGFTIAKRKHELAKLYELCSFSQVLLYLPTLDKKFTGSWRTPVAYGLATLPCTAFLATMVYVHFWIQTPLAGIVEFWNIITAFVFAGLSVWLMTTIYSIQNEWLRWWSAARREQSGPEYVGRWSYDAMIDGPEMKDFAHSGTVQISYTPEELKVVGKSTLLDSETQEKQECDWLDSQAVLVGDQLLLRFYFQSNGHQIKAEIEVNTRLLDSKSMSGSYYQLMPEVYMAQGKVVFTRPNTSA